MENWGLITTAIVAVAGITATFFAPWWTQGRIERRRELHDFRVAKRLVTLELRRLIIDLGAIRDAPAIFDPVLTGFLDVPEWEAHKATLARSLSEDAWGHLRDTYTAVEKMRAALTLGHGRELTEGHKRLLGEVIQIATRAVSTIGVEAR